MVDKVKPLALESTSLGGGDDFPTPTEMDPSEDYVSAKGVAFENNDNRLMDMDGSGNIQFKDATETSYIQIWKLRRALHNIFDNTGTDLTSLNVEDAIKEVRELSKEASKGFVFSSYGGNALTGRFLEFFPNIDSDTAPISSQNGLEIVEITGETTSASATCTIGFYNDTTLLHTITFSAQKQVVETGNPIFTLPASGNLKIKIDSGSILNPHVYFIARGA